MDQMNHIPHLISTTWIIVILAVPVALSLIGSGVWWLTHREARDVKRRCVQFLGAGLFVADLLVVAMCLYMLIVAWI